MKRIGVDNNKDNIKDNKEIEIPVSRNGPDKVEEVLSSLPASVIDSMEKDNIVEFVASDDNNETEDTDKGPAFPDPETYTNQPVQQDMSVHTKEFYDNQGGFKPAIEHPTVNRETVNKTRQNKKAQPSTEIDLENLDESMIMDMPEIKATSFKIIDILDPKPIDKAIRFRWANCKNHVAGNLGKYLAVGFQVACLDDVDQKRTPIDPSMRDGTQVKYYDVILLKINVIRLMELYKTNIIKSVNKLAKAKEKGLAEATRQFQSDVSSEPGASRAYNHYKQALGHDPVEFFATE